MFGLAGDAKNFVFSKGSYLGRTLVVFFPMVVAVAALAATAKNLGWPYAAYIPMLPYLLVYGCYVLSWHRTSLISDGEPHIVTPFRLAKSDLVFLGFFITMCLLLTTSIFLIDLAATYAAQELKITMDDPRRHWVALSTFAACLLPLYLFVRASFVLPAQSVGHTLKFREVMTASRGMVWRLIGAIFTFMILLALIMMIYSSVALEIVGVAVSESRGLSMVQEIVISLMISAPIQILILVTMALMTTALSKAYRWGIENNPL